LTPFKTRYLLTSIICPYCGLRFRAYRGHSFFFFFKLATVQVLVFDWIGDSSQVNILESGAPFLGLAKSIFYFKLIEYCMTKGFHVSTFLTNCTAYNSFTVPAAAPRLNTVVALDNQRAFVSWFTLPQDEFGALFLRGYRVHYLSYRNYQTRNVTARPDQLQVELTDLDPDTWYSIWITAFTTMGEGPRSYSYWIKSCK